MNTPGPPLPDTDRTRHLLHELEVHQIELEMQNEELHKSRALAEAALAVALQAIGLGRGRDRSDLAGFQPASQARLPRPGAPPIIGALRVDGGERLRQRRGLGERRRG